MANKNMSEALPRSDFPSFLMKNYDPLRHKTKADLIHLVKTEIDLYWDGDTLSAIIDEDKYKRAVDYLKKLRTEI